MKASRKVDMPLLREALEASWKPDTAYMKVQEKGNPAYGQCYPTSKVVQIFFPKTKIVVGEVWTSKRMEKHFWNILEKDGSVYHIDFTWQQFPKGSKIKSYEILDQDKNKDGLVTVNRVKTLLNRVNKYIDSQIQSPGS